MIVPYWRRAVGLVRRSSSEIGLIFGWLVFTGLIAHGAYGMVVEGKALAQIIVPIVSWGALLIAGTIRYVMARRR